MRTSMLTALVLSLACALLGANSERAFAQTPAGVVLWGSARSGMTAAQVEALVPSGHAIARPDVSSWGALARWTTPVTGFGAPAVATFYFSGNRLALVILRLTGPAVTDRFAERIVAQISAKQGQPVGCQRQPGFEHDCVWLNGRMAVTTSATTNLHASSAMEANLMAATYYREHVPPALSRQLFDGGSR